MSLLFAYNRINCSAYNWIRLRVGPSASFRKNSVYISLCRHPIPIINSILAAAAAATTVWATCLGLAPISALQFCSESGYKVLGESEFVPFVSF